jgi:hypothetical protein
MMRDNVLYHLKEGSMGDPTDAKQEGVGKGYELAKAVRSEFAGYLAKGIVALALGLLSFVVLGYVGYVEWRIRQIAGGVPKGAILTFANTDGGCPEGWTYFARARSRVIVGSEPNTEVSSDTYPRRLQVLEQSGELAEYVFTKAAPREGRQLAANEIPVRVPGFLALTYCMKEK